MQAGAVTAVTPAIKRAMVLAAGLGTRMAPLTEDWPKSLIEIGGRTMLDRTLDALATAGVDEAVVNTHHLGYMIAAHLEGRTRPAIRLSPEDELLETGGGVAYALRYLGRGPFYVINGDAVWTEGPRQAALVRLAGAWEDEEMDALLLVYPSRSVGGYEGVGDFVLDPVGRVRRKQEGEIAPFLFTGIQILHPRLFAGAPKGAFSLNRLYDVAQEAGRLHAAVHDGRWFHIGTPDAIADVEDFLSERDETDPF